MLRSLIDTLPWWLLLPLLIAIFLIVAEVTFHVGLRRRKRSDENTKSYVSLVLGSLLALLGFLLAFSYSIAESRYQMRKQLLLDEANAITRTFLRAEMLPAGRVEPIKDLLRRYVDIRLELRTVEDLPAALAASKAIQVALWSEAVASGQEDSESRFIPLFVRSLNEVIDLQQSRFTYAAYYRLPVPILVTLLAVAALGMALLGYVSGLGGSRSFLADAGHRCSHCGGPGARDGPRPPVATALRGEPGAAGRRAGGHVHLSIVTRGTDRRRGWRRPASAPRTRSKLTGSNSPQAVPRRGRQ